MTAFVDLAIAAILIIALALGVKRGLIASIAGIVSAVAAFFGASLAADYLTPMVEEYLQPRVLEKLAFNLQGTQTADGTTMLGLLGFDGENLSNMLQNVTQRIRETGEGLLTAVAGSVAHSAAYALVFLVSFIVLILLLGLLVKLFEKVKIPVLSQIDSIAGGLLGLVEGILVVFLVVWAMGKFHWIITPELIDSSVFLKFFVENTPASLLAGLTGIIV